MPAFQDIQELDRLGLPIRSRYNQLYSLLVACLNDKTRGLTIEFSGAFARLDFLCRQIGYKEQHPAAYRQICAFRGRSKHLVTYSDTLLNALYAVDMRAVCEFVAALYEVEVPSSLKLYLSADYPEAAVRETLTEVLRCSVESISAESIRLTGPLGEEWLMPWQYLLWDTLPRDLTYLRGMLKTGSQLNLVRPTENDGWIYAEQVIYEPDLLIDITSITACFESCGNTAYHYLIKLLYSDPINSSQLLGSFAGQMLDEEVHALGEGTPRSYQESIKEFFAQHTLSVVTCSDMLIADSQRKFHEQARLQQLNIRVMVQRAFSQDRTIDLQKVVLEPSFYCETLGLQGRMDLLQSDKHVLMEQKSGKMDEYRHAHQKKHFVQVLLYQAMLHYGYHDDRGRTLSNDDIASYLLYSRYPDGLMKEAPAPTVLEEALRLRNQIAHLQLLLSRGEAEHLYSHLKPETFNVENQQGRLWTEFICPQLEAVLDRINHASELQQAYFYRMLTFVAREHMLSKMGNGQKVASGFAALWNSTSAEKREAGDLMDHLQITVIGEDLQTLTLQWTNEGDDTDLILPNFRIGDIVVLYSYPSDSEPDARRDMVFRANIIQMTAESIVVKLRGQQKNQSLFHPEEEVYWAIEHDFMESSYNGEYRGIYSFLEATASRRDLLLAQREPRIDDTLTLANDYGKFNDLVLKFKQAQDYFLLVGPPGTGKTSHGLVNILNEQLASYPEGNVLLVSFTNRAVDEICSKLVKMELPFVRISSEVSCPDEYKPYLLSTRCKQYNTAQEIRNLIQGSRVVVGTTTSMTSGLSIFTLKQFDLCIIDEASQILEPHLIALLSARHGDEDAISKWVMIGDHKQLPAVVQQTEPESEVNEPILQNIGLFNCRQSLFERLIRLNQHNDSLIYTLCAQGRMHHDVAAFANRAFYGSQLYEVPLEHQQRDIPYHTHRQDVFSQMLTRQRFSFVDVRKARPEHCLVSDKVNIEEALQIARIVHAAYELFKENELDFNPLESIGVIVPYRHQIATIRKHLEQYDVPGLADITIDTVERYQGSQRDIIIYGFTISKPYQLDFLTNNCFEENGQIIDRKLNVALTRAREIMVLVGDSQLLNQNKIFAELIHSSSRVNLPVEY